MAEFVEHCLACGFERITTVSDCGRVTFNAFCGQCGQPTDFPLSKIGKIDS
jgi:transcription elongation factor Elf1